MRDFEKFLTDCSRIPLKNSIVVIDELPLCLETDEKSR